MATERSANIRRIFEAALTRPTDERAAYLEVACGGDTDLRAEVEALLDVAEPSADPSQQTTAAIDPGDRRAAYEPPKFPAGEVLSDRFHIGRLLGRGGMGEVYEAFDLQLNDRVALKTIRGGVTSKDTIARLRHEVVLARQVTHPNVCRIFDLGQHVDKATGEEVAYLTMELLEGETLAHRIHRRKKIPVSEAILIGEQIAEALAAAHRAGVIHRDLKPGNVMLVKLKDGSAAERSVITDFGLARVSENADWADNATPTHLTGSGEILGTLVYMAPEQIRGQSITDATDIYALGIILYQMLSGRRPFEEYTLLATIFKRLEGPPAPLRSLVPEIDHWLEETIMQCLAVDPSLRLQSARELAAILRQLASGSPEPREPSASYSSSPSLAQAVSEFRKQIDVSSSSTAAPVRIPIAVLPFTNMGPDSDSEYFSDGLGEELMAALAKVDGLRLAARASSFRFRGGDYDVRNVGRQLNVEAVVEGSVRRAGNRLRVNVQLVDTAEGYQLWSELYDRQLEDVFAVQEEIANAVVSQLKLRLTNSAESYFRRHRTRDIEAYNRYLKGRYFWNKRTQADLQKAAEHFQEAARLDPNFAPALAGLADCYVTLAMYGARAPLDTFPLAKQAIARALALDAKLPEAYCTDGCIRAVFDWNWAAAEQSFRKSLELGPYYATGHHWFAINFLVPLKRMEEAQHHLQLARETDPLSLIINTTIGLEKFFERQYDDAVSEYQRVLEMEPGFAMGYFFLGQALERLGALPDAIAALERSVDLSSRSLETLSMVSYVYGTVGRESEARAILEELKDRALTHYISPVLLAQVHLGLGAKADALDCLEKAYKVRASDLMWIGLRPIFEPLANEVRFQNIVQSIGLA